MTDTERYGALATALWFAWAALLLTAARLVLYVVVCVADYFRGK